MDLDQGSSQEGASLSYYFIHAQQFLAPGSSLTFATALRVSGIEDPTTRINPLQVNGLPPGVSGYVVQTYTEVVAKIFAGEAWHDEFVTGSQFRAFHVPEEQLLIVNTGRLVAQMFVRSARAKSEGQVIVYPIAVDLAALGKEVPRARRIRLERLNTAGVSAGLQMLIGAGADVERAPEIEAYRASGGESTGLQFMYAPTDWPDIEIAVTGDASVRLMRHVGPRNDPQVAKEVELVLSVWHDHLAKHHAVKYPRSHALAPRERHFRPTPSTGGDGTSALERPAEGQQALDDLLES
jgi:hypothetical protein